MTPKQRAVQAGAVEPLEEIGRGGEGVVFCDARRHAYKVGHAASRKRGRTLQDEAEWLETAKHVPWVKDHVAKFIRYDQKHDVIVRECVEVRSAPLGGGHRSPDEAQVWTLMHEIARHMSAYGWTAPERKRDSVVATRDRGLVVVDGGFAYRKGPRFARWVGRLLAGQETLRSSETLSGVADELHAEIETGRLNRAVGEKLLRRIEKADQVRDNPRTMAKAKSTKKSSPKKPRKSPSKRARVKLSAKDKRPSRIAVIEDFLRSQKLPVPRDKRSKRWRDAVKAYESRGAAFAKTVVRSNPTARHRKLSKQQRAEVLSSLRHDVQKARKPKAGGYTVGDEVLFEKKAYVVYDFDGNGPNAPTAVLVSKNVTEIVDDVDLSRLSKHAVRSNPMNAQSAAVKRLILAMRANNFTRFKTVKHMFESGDLNGVATQLIRTSAVEAVFEGHNFSGNGGGGYNLVHANAVGWLKRNRALVARWLDAASANEHTARRAVEKVRNNPTKSRYYRLIAVNEKTGKKTLLTRTPVTHSEGVTMMRKFTSHPGRRVQLEETSAGSYSLRGQPRNNPITTKTSHRRLNASDSCDVSTASQLLRDRKKAKKDHKKRPYRYGNCATPSAEYVLAHHGRSKGSTEPKASPERKVRSANGSLVDWFW